MHVVMYDRKYFSFACLLLLCQWLEPSVFVFCYLFILLTHLDIIVCRGQVFHYYFLQPVTLSLTSCCAQLLIDVSTRTTIKNRHWPAEGLPLCSGKQRFRQFKSPGGETRFQTISENSFKAKLLVNKIFRKCSFIEEIQIITKPLKQSIWSMIIPKWEKIQYLYKQESILAYIR